MRANACIAGARSSGSTASTIVLGRRPPRLRHAPAAARRPDRSWRSPVAGSTSQTYSEPASSAVRNRTSASACASCARRCSSMQLFGALARAHQFALVGIAILGHEQGQLVELHASCCAAPRSSPSGSGDRRGAGGRASLPPPSPGCAAAAPSASGGRSCRPSTAGPGSGACRPARRGSKPSARRTCGWPQRMAVGIGQQQAAGAPVVQREAIGESVSAGAVSGIDTRSSSCDRNASMASVLAAGALRCGQCPTLSITRNVRVWQRAVQVFADRARRDEVVAALQDQGRSRQAWQVRAVVGQERDPREMRGDLRDPCGRNCW